MNLRQSLLQYCGAGIGTFWVSAFRRKIVLRCGGTCHKLVSLLEDIRANFQLIDPR